MAELQLLEVACNRRAGSSERRCRAGRHSSALALAARAELNDITSRVPANVSASSCRATCQRPAFAQVLMAVLQVTVLARNFLAGSSASIDSACSHKQARSHAERAAPKLKISSFRSWPSSEKKASASCQFP